MNLLERLYLSHNTLENIDKLAFLSKLNKLVELTLECTPIASEKNYKSTILSYCPNLKKLDSSDVLPSDFNTNPVTKSAITAKTISFTTNMAFPNSTHSQSANVLPQTRRPFSPPNAPIVPNNSSASNQTPLIPNLSINNVQPAIPVVPRAPTPKTETVTPDTSKDKESILARIEKQFESNSEYSDTFFEINEDESSLAM